MAIGRFAPRACRQALYRALVVAVLGVVGGPVLAAEIILFEDANFGGEQLTLRGSTPQIAETGFNERAGSLVIVSGRWEMCSEPNFRGSCTTLTRGEYASLDRRLAGRISSAREVGSYPEQSGGYSDYGRGVVQLFSRPGFQGLSVELKSDSPTLTSAGFNDRAASVVVTSGTWQLCAGADYGGDCRTFAPGRYPDLGAGMANSVSSARLVRPVSQAPAVITPGGVAPPSGEPGRAVLYGAPGLRGASLAVSGPLGELSRAGFDGATASMVVEAGHFLACSEPFFRGDCRVFAPGRYDSLDAVGLQQRISSIRPVAPPRAPVPVPVPATPPVVNSGLMLFAEPEFGGARLGVERDVGSLGRRDFANRAASAIVYDGTWELCTDEAFAGRCAVYRPGRYPRMGGLTGRVSSLRRIQ